MSKITFSEDSNGSSVGEMCSNLVNCLRVTTMIGAATPFVTWLGLYIVKPSFIMKKDFANNFQEIDAWKMLLWVVVITVIVWTILFAYDRYYGDKADRICMASPNF